MAHPCKCAVCGIQFDRDKIQATKYSSRRYAHYECYPTGELVPMPPPKPEKPKSDEQKIKEYMKQILGNDYNAARINKQIRQFRNEYGFTDNGILKSLEYWYSIKQNDPSKSGGGIGIVPYIYQDAKNYYIAIFMAEQANQGINVVAATSQVKEVTIKEPKVDRPLKMFNLDDLEED